MKQPKLIFGDKESIAIRDKLENNPNKGESELDYWLNPYSCHGCGKHIKDRGFCRKCEKKIP